MSRRLEWGDAITISTGDDGETVARYVDLILKVCFCGFLKWCGH